MRKTRSADATRQELERTQVWLERLKYALDQSSIVAITDIRGRIIYVNDKFCEISGYAAEELLGRDHRIVNSGYHSKEEIQNLWETIQRGEVWRGELRNRRKDGSIYWVDTTIVPLLDESGKPEQYLAIRNDITEKKRVEALLRSQETMARLGQMAAVIAHEVRNPLAGISAAIQVIIHRLPDGCRDSTAVLKDVLTRVAGLDEVVSGLLDFARPRPPKLRECSLRDIVDRAVQLMRDHPSRKDVRLTVLGEDALLRADPEMLARAVFNLIVNALQAIESHPTQDDDFAGAVKIEIGHGVRDVTLSVTDNGPGLSPEMVDKLFQPFVTTKINGTGLGLAVVKSSIESHGGSIDVTSRPGATRFTLQLPKAGPAPG